jgi:hypothetical protein
LKQNFHAADAIKKTPSINSERLFFPFKTPIFLKKLSSQYEVCIISMVSGD